MVKGKKKVDLNIDTILTRLSEYDIFKYYMPHSWTVNEATLSPFRVEENPSFMIGNKYGKLFFIDFADTSKKGDCWEFVKMLYGISLDKALLKIDNDFKLGISTGVFSDEYKTIVSQYKQPEEAGKRYSFIQVITRPFTKEELKYWSDYHQDISDLRINHIYAPKKVFLNKKLFHLGDEMAFAYFYDGYWKIYRPFASKKNKWVPNNVSSTVMDGKENIKDCDIAFINKSKKDYMVMKKILPCCCGVQNESIACFSEENVKFLKDNSKRQILSFDSDIPGVANSQQITRLFNFDYCNVPRKYLEEGIKDWADLAKTHGLEVITNYLKEKQIIC